MPILGLEKVSLSFRSISYCTYTEVVSKVFAQEVIGENSKYPNSMSLSLVRLLHHYFMNTLRSHFSSLNPLLLTQIYQSPRWRPPISILHASTFTFSAQTSPLANLPFSTKQHSSTTNSHTAMKSTKRRPLSPWPTS